MIVLGLIDSKPSAAAVVVDGVVASAIAEERLCRMKMAGGMPRDAVARVLGESGVTVRDLDCVAVAQRVSTFEPEPVPWSDWFADHQAGKNGRLEALGSRLAPLIGGNPLAWKSHHALKDLLSSQRRVKIAALLRDAYGITAPVRFFDHHYCHAVSAYFTSSFGRALVVTLDGGGDGRSGSVYLGDNGRLTELASVDSFNSLGNFYSYITALCGFKAERHEGKVTGLAAMGEPEYADILRQFVRYEDPGQIRYSVPMYHRSALKLLADRLPRSFNHANLAASVQQVLEEVGTAFVRYWLRRTGLRQIAVAGGVFANVKFNQRVHEIEEVERFFVHPAMDDSGLSVGSALAVAAERSAKPLEDLVRCLPNVYFGPAFSDAEIAAAVAASGFPAQYTPGIHGSIADLLANGFVVARFTGRMEYGPRALGHRSILYKTTDPSVNDWLNERLRRSEFMPFAPITLAKHASSCYEGLEGAEDPARFMTVTFNCTSAMRATSPGVVHVDGTARPQIVDPDTAADSHKILTEYHRLTGIPSLVNTSFNMHEEPIVCTPEDALRSFQQGGLDYLAIGNWLVANPRGPVPRQESQATAAGALELS